MPTAIRKAFMYVFILGLPVNVVAEPNPTNRLSDLHVLPDDVLAGHQDFNLLPPGLP